MLREELVEEEKWITRERFNRVLSVYQVLPGPEAHELCVYFGMLKGGRMGGFLAGLAFMLPGFVLMLALSWFYLRYGLTIPLFAAVFAGFQPAVAALIVRAVQRIAQHALTDRWLVGLAMLGGIAELLKIHFALTLVFAGLAYVLVRRHRLAAAGLLTAAFLSAIIYFSISVLEPAAGLPAGPAASFTPPSILALFGYGLRAGLLTFGGAYTVIPFLQRDAVVVGGWMTGEQFLDGLALSGILPAPLIIFSTFVGYLGGGGLGALAITAGIFLPAFSFTLIGHDYMERLVENRALHNFLDGVTAGVVGLIGATALTLLFTALDNPPAVLIFVLGLLVLFAWKAKGAVAVVVLGAGLLGLLLYR